MRILLVDPSDYKHIIKPKEVTKPKQPSLAPDKAPQRKMVKVSAGTILLRCGVESIAS